MIVSHVNTYYIWYDTIVSTLKYFWKWWNIFYLTHWLDQFDSSHCFSSSWSLLWFVRFIHFTEFNLIWLISIIFFNAEHVFDFDLIIESAELSSSLIHLTTMISRRSYNWRNVITSIINRFFTVMLSRIKQSYKDFESVTSIREMRLSSIFIKIAFSTESTSKSWIIV